MKSHLQYLSYVVRHKWFVFRAGLRTGAPLWRLIIHDYSKFSKAEWTPYVRSFYGKQGRTQEVRDAFNTAWLHHQHHNPHHWQHWVLQEDEGSIKCLLIPEDLVKEMVADWMGAGRAITGLWEVHNWYQENSQKIRMHPKSQDLVEVLIRKVST